MYWSFAIINNKIGEIYFSRKGRGYKIEGHCYDKREEFSNKEELKVLDEDIKKYRFVYRNKKYKRVE